MTRAKRKLTGSVRLLFDSAHKAVDFSLLGHISIDWGKETAAYFPTMRYFVFVLLLFSVLESSQCVVWSWIWSVDPTNGKNPGSNAKNTTLHTVRVEKVECRKNKHCGDGKFCHRHYRTCHDCKPVGAHCRRDQMCCKKMECMFGKCRTIVPPGQIDAKCKKDRDCNKGLCCAKTHGEFICKRMLQEDEVCTVSSGGIAYSLNHNCPCQEGLVCRKLRLRHKKRNLRRLLRNENKLRRCQRLRLN